MINQQEWLKTRKNLLAQVKSQVELRLGRPTGPLRRYAKSVDREFRGNWRACPVRDLRKALAQAKVVLSADFHAYSQSQRAHLRLLRDHVKRSKVILAMECISTEHESIVQDFLAGKLTEKNFLKAVNWTDSWGFPWENYRPLFELARERGYLIKGLSHDLNHTLKRRDEDMAKSVAKWLRENPQALIYVVVGELHLATQHLPKRLAKSLSRPSDTLVVFQDVEPLYFRLAERNKEDSTEFLRGPGNRFCFMVSPPWMKWQSYLMFLEHLYDRDLTDDIQVDYTDHLVQLVELLEKDLKIRVGTAKIQVYSPQSRVALNRLRRSLPKKHERALIYHVEHDLSFYLPEKDWLYLSRPTINHAATLAGQFIHAHLCQRRRALWNMPEDFLAGIWVEAMGFLFSKWINPQRKADSLDSLRVRLEALHPRDKGRATLLLALEQRLREVVFKREGKTRPLRFKPRHQWAYWDAARILGAMLGERLFQNLKTRTLSLNQLMSYLKVDVEDDTFAQFYWQVIGQLEHESSQ